MGIKCKTNCVFQKDLCCTTNPDIDLSASLGRLHSLDCVCNTFEAKPVKSVCHCGCQVFTVSLSGGSLVIRCAECDSLFVGRRLNDDKKVSIKHLWPGIFASWENFRKIYHGNPFKPYDLFIAKKRLEASLGEIK
jgi:hypothetical protein